MVEEVVVSRQLHTELELGEGTVSGWASLCGRVPGVVQGAELGMVGTCFCLSGCGRLVQLQSLILTVGIYLAPGVLATLC